MSALLQLNKGDLDSLNILATRGETQYWSIDAATLKTQIGESNLRAFLRKLDTEINGVQVWWDEDIENSGEYDFGISVCDAHLSPPVYNAKPVCICPE